MKKVFRWGRALMIFGLVVFAVDYYRTRGMTKAPELPAHLSTIQGKAINLNALSREKPVLIYFWATWCGPCKTTSPTVQWLSHEHQVITIALDSGSDADVATFMADARYDFPVINDPTWHLGKLFNVGATPTIIIIKEGQVSSSTVGISTPWGLWLRLMLA